MLIIPAERTLDWRRPPVVTLLLILINLFIFLGYQSRDEGLWQHAFTYYSNNELIELEAPEYVDYLERAISLHGDPRTDLPSFVQQRIQAGDAETLGLIILSDRDYSRYLKQEGPRFWQDQDYRRWLEHRTHLEQTWLDRISSHRFGLIPSNLGLAELFTYQFLHGDFGHLIGNMVFLFLLGFAIEAAVGGFRYLLAYLLCGALSGIFFSLIEGNSLIPLVGASGAISGLMGMYVTLYGLRKIRFFFWIGVYFNYFKAPALWLLPVWVGKEFFEFWRDDNSRIAYMAHAGGLLAGAGLVWLLRQNWFKIEEPVAQQDAEKDLEFMKAYSAALEAISRIDFAQARQRFIKLIALQPDNLGMLEHLYHLDKLAPERPEFVTTADQFISAALKANQTDLALSTYRDCVKRSAELQRLPANLHYRALMASLKNNALKDAEAAFQSLRETNSNLDMIRDGCQALLNIFRQREMATKAQYYQALAQELEQSQLQG
jgi:membrane associated rhomboid family serine protease